MVVKALYLGLSFYLIFFVLELYEVWIQLYFAIYCHRSWEILVFPIFQVVWLATICKMNRKLKERTLRRRWFFLLDDAYVLYIFEFVRLAMKLNFLPNNLKKKKKKELWVVMYSLGGLLNIHPISSIQIYISMTICVELTHCDQLFSE